MQDTGRSPRSHKGSKGKFVRRVDVGESAVILAPQKNQNTKPKIFRLIKFHSWMLELVRWQIADGIQYFSIFKECFKGCLLIQYTEGDSN